METGTDDNLSHLFQSPFQRRNLFFGSETERSLHCGEEFTAVPKLSRLLWTAIPARKFLTTLRYNVRRTISIPWPYLCPLELQRVSPCLLPWSTSTLSNLNKWQAVRKRKHNLFDHQEKVPNAMPGSTNLSLRRWSPSPQFLFLLKHCSWNGPGPCPSSLALYMLSQKFTKL